MTRNEAILLIEDDPVIAGEVLMELRRNGFQACHAGTCATGLAALRGGDFGAVITDRLLPDGDGLSLVETLRAEAIKTPVIVLSALSTMSDRVKGLKAGGDDYLVKPFALEELMARLEALLRRPVQTRETTLRVGELTLDLIERRAFRGKTVIELLPREFKLLEYLMRRTGQIVTRAMLLEDVWGYRFVPQTNLVDVHLGKLRRKIDLPGDVSLIESVRGTGFVIRDARPR